MKVPENGFYSDRYFKKNVSLRLLIATVTVSTWTVISVTMSDVGWEIENIAPRIERMTVPVSPNTRKVVSRHGACAAQGSAPRTR
jgi:hypothetical protein